MPISSIRLQQFRSYDDATFILDPHVNVVAGPNGSGKTNLLEALFVVARGKSFRVQDADLLAYDTDWSRLDVQADEHERSISLKKNGQKVEKRLHIDGALKKRLGARERLRVVLFEPRDMQLLTGSPERRREYIDSILEQLHIGYSTTLARYRRALAQRNHLLKNAHDVPADHLFVWNVRLSELGAQIIARRRQLITELNDHAQKMYNSISGAKAQVAVRYVEQCAGDSEQVLASALLRRIEHDFATDRQRGFTRTGPHRDDMELFLNEANASVAASRGETRSLVIMLKLLEAQLLTDQFEAKPLVLLDDVFGELDQQRRHALATHFTDHQVVITATDVDLAEGAANIIKLKV